MRPDMSKVVTEAPRSGSGYNNHHKNDVTATRKRWRGANAHVIASDCDDDYWSPERSHAFKATSLQRTPWDTKSFSDVLGPLRGYLKKQIGRPWNDVYAEMNRHLDKRGTAGSHIWDHVWHEVQRHVHMGVDGKPYTYRRGRWLSGGPLRNCLYVHPDTGLLCQAPMDSYRWSWRVASIRYRLWAKLKTFGFEWTSEEKLVCADWRIVDDLHVLQRINGCWFVHVFERLDPNDVIALRIIGDREIQIRRKDDQKAARIRRVSTRQIGRRDKHLWKLVHRQVA